MLLLLTFMSGMNIARTRANKQRKRQYTPPREGNGTRQDSSYISSREEGGGGNRGAGELRNRGAGEMRNRGAGG